MSDAQFWSNVEQIPTTISDDIIASSKALQGINGAYIARAMSEITYESQTAGPDLITLTLTDPDWVIQTSGLVDVGADGLLQPVDFNFPKGTDVWWRLAEWNNQGGDLSDAAVQLVFYHRSPVVYLMQDFGTPIKAAPGTTTQAQFVKQLCDRIPGSLPASLLGPGTLRSQRIQFICPELNVVQPLTATGQAGYAASTSTDSDSGYTTSTSTDAATAKAQLNKGKGIGYGASLTCQGVQLTNQQIDICNAALTEADSLNATSVVMVAIIYAAMGESRIGADPGQTYNVWQVNADVVYEYGPDPNWTAMAKAWLQGDAHFQGGGGLGNAKQYSAAWQIANATEANAAWDGSLVANTPYSGDAPHTLDSYAARWPGGQAQGISEATKIVNAFGGGSDGYANFDGTSSSATTTQVVSNVGQLERGGVDNPGEDSWSCIQRIASAQNWEAYTSVHNGEGQWGNYFIYITGPRNDKQIPSAYLTRSELNPGTWDMTKTGKSTTMVTRNALLQQPSGTVDNTAYSGSTTVKRNGKLRQRARIQIPQTPTQIQIQIIAEPMTLNAGEVIVFERSGPINGPWIITDNTRNIIGDQFSTLTLGPPIDPLPQETTTESSTKVSTATNVQGDNITAKSGSLTKASQIAQSAAALETSSNCYTYSESTAPAGSGEVRTNSGNSALSAPWTFDCSGFCCTVYKGAGLPDPGGTGSYDGNTASIAGYCTQIALGDAVPGDIVLFGDPGGPTAHAVIYIGSGACVSMGEQGEPKIETVANEAAYENRGLTGYYRCPNT